MSGVYSMTGGPTYTGATGADLMQSAMDEPLSVFSTLGQSAKSGVLESFGLGTFLKDKLLPEEAPTVAGAPRIVPDNQGGYTYKRETPEEMTQRRTDMGALSEDQYKASAFFRKDIPWDAGMTADRAAALAQFDDAKKARDYFTQKRPIAAFIGNLGGQAIDPINYIPILGEGVKAAQIARFGYIGGHLLTSAADAALNTGIASVATSGERAKFGDDVSWQATISQMAMAALIGGAFGAIGGALGRHTDARVRSDAESRLSTLQTTQEARIALNEGIDAIVRGEDVNLSPNATEPMTRVAGEVANLSRAYDDVRSNPTGDVRDPLVAITPDDIEGMIVARGAFKDINELEFSKRGWGLVKVVWGHGDKSAEPPEFQVSKADITDLPNVIRNYEPSSVSQDGLRREWRVQRDGRAVVYADSMMGDKGRHLVTTYIARTPEEMNVPLSKERPAALPGSLPQAGNLVGDTVGDRSIGTPKAEQSMPATVNIAQSVAVDNSKARPEPLPEGHKQAEASVAKPEDTKALAAQFGVDPQSGAFKEEADIAQLADEGRLTEQDVMTLAQAHADFETADGYAEALKSVAGCLI
ncbi:hypothetical protein LB542_19690 [Mesorhizobium sp. BR1-1-9]|uniref:hypothetical protein n=1 Tax=Mesorhizobium sp. BR1-1-9 TaxID=2876646 RepID=UPI001CD10B84|nr:hypothetical protein [Mesorhizobium sp. BR1-1-9]MBZ9873073.1 hypothetical protein [Mesorhizobium sp. BR1-1-9]